MKSADFEWYLSKSREINGPHRCPFAAANRCPRYYESLYSLGEVGIATKISPENKVKLDELWKNFETTIGEEAASVSGGESNSTKAMSNFCPEVSYKIFGLFASGLFPCHGEIDRNMADSRLRRAGIKTNDPRWHWADFTPAHYSECSEYSILQAQGTIEKGESETVRTVFNIQNVQGAVGHVANSPVTLVQASGKNDLKAQTCEHDQITEPGLIGNSSTKQHASVENAPEGSQRATKQPTFHGLQRKAIFEKLQSAWLSEGTCVAILQGFPGCGKTQLASAIACKDRIVLDPISVELGSSDPSLDLLLNLAATLQDHGIGELNVEIDKGESGDLYDALLKVLRRDPPGESCAAPRTKCSKSASLHKKFRMKRCIFMQKTTRCCWKQI